MVSSEGTDGPLDTVVDITTGMVWYLKGVSQLFQPPYQLVRANLIINLCKGIYHIYLQRIFHFSIALNPDLYPDWIRIQRDPWIRIRDPDLDPRGPK
jgi:hypothetical protein